MRMLIAATAFASAIGAAEAATLTFDTSNPLTYEFAEDGFYGDVSAYDSTGYGTIHGFAGAASPSAYIQRTEPFRAIAVEIGGHGGYNIGPNGESLSERIPYDNVIFTGFLNDQQVAWAATSTGTEGRSFIYTFGRKFGRIDALEISTPYPGIGPNGEGCVDCTAFEFDNLVYELEPIAPIPLPASALLHISGIAGIAALRKRTKPANR